MDDNKHEQNPLVGQPYGGVNRRPEDEEELPGERAGEESVTERGRSDSDARSPTGSRAADEPMSSDAVDPYSSTEPEPGPPNPLPRRDEST